ncbi:MAG TPA: hypothetical protein VH540_19995 [Ktedonobacterales bacterium]
MLTFEHPHLKPEYLQAAKAAPPPPAEPFPRQRKGPRPISILGVHLPMLPVKMFPYFVILQVCAAIEACHRYMEEQGIMLSIRYGSKSSVYDIDAPWAAYTTFGLGRQPDEKLRRLLGYEVERMQRIHETTLETITPYERQVTTLIAAHALTQVYREIRKRHKAAVARAWLQEELDAMRKHAERLAEFWQAGGGRQGLRMQEVLARQRR